MLQASELALDGGAATVEAAPVVATPRDTKVALLVAAAAVAAAGGEDGDDQEREHGDEGDTCHRKKYARGAEAVSRVASGAGNERTAREHPVQSSHAPVRLAVVGQQGRHATHAG
jgi:hypothetical protein